MTRRVLAELTGLAGVKKRHIETENCKGRISLRNPRSTNRVLETQNHVARASNSRTTTSSSRSSSTTSISDFDSSGQHSYHSNQNFELEPKLREAGAISDIHIEQHSYHSDPHIRNRWMMVVAGMWIMCCSGSSYLYSDYSESIKWLQGEALLHGFAPDVLLRPLRPRDVRH